MKPTFSKKLIIEKEASGWSGVSLVKMDKFDKK
jgi:hypothetical protein